MYWQKIVILIMVMDMMVDRHLAMNMMVDGHYGNGHDGGWTPWRWT